MKQVEMFSRPGCGHAERAKRLLGSKGAQFVEFNVWSDPALMTEMTRRANGGRTTPQIFIGGAHVGGSDELHALDRAGRLDKLLAA